MSDCARSEFAQGAVCTATVLPTLLISPSLSNLALFPSFSTSIAHLKCSLNNVLAIKQFLLYLIFICKNNAWNLFAETLTDPCGIRFHMTWINHLCVLTICNFLPCLPPWSLFKQMQHFHLMLSAISDLPPLFENCDITHCFFSCLTLKYFFGHSTSYCLN